MLLDVYICLVNNVYISVSACYFNIIKIFFIHIFMFYIFPFYFNFSHFAVCFYLFFNLGLSLSSYNIFACSSFKAKWNWLKLNETDWSTNGCIISTPPPPTTSEAFHTYNYTIQNCDEIWPVLIQGVSWHFNTNQTHKASENLACLNTCTSNKNIHNAREFI